MPVGAYLLVFYKEGPARKFGPALFIAGARSTLFSLFARLVVIHGNTSVQGKARTTNIAPNIGCTRVSI